MVETLLDLSSATLRGEHYCFPNGKRLHYKFVAYAILGHVCSKCGVTWRLTIHHKNHNPDDHRIENLEVHCENCRVEHHRNEPPFQYV